MNYDLSSIAPGLTYAAATLSLVLGTIVAIRDSRSFSNRSFTGMLVLLGLIEIAGILKISSGNQDQLMQRYMARSIILSIAPGTGLLFSLSFARQEYRKFLKDWKYIIIASFALPLGIMVSPLTVFDVFPAEDNYLTIGYAGKAFYASIVLIAVLILANLERTLRASIGRIRWQIKFIFLGMAIICADWIYTGSQAIIYGAIDTSFSVMHSVSLLCANLLFVWGLVRSRFLKIDIYMSRSTIQYSLTTLFVSLYLIILGLLAYRARFFDPEQPLPIVSLLVMLALAGLVMLLLSDRLQERFRRFVTYNFRRPIYDYRKIWIELTEKTSTFITAEDLCNEVSKIISKTFGILSVNIWICDEDLQRLSLAGSTVFTKALIQDLERKDENVAALLATIEGGIVDLRERNFAWADDIMAAAPEFFNDFKMRYIVPLRSGGLLTGIITLNDDKVGRAPLSIEDRDLFHAYSSQIAAHLLQMRLAENLRKAQEIEAFQNVTTFFVHDLKNLASRLSLTMQNLPSYFNNPEFREDALKLIGESVEKIETTCARLSSLKRKIELKPEDVELHQLVQSSAEDFRNIPGSSIDIQLGDIPSLSLDQEQMQKVLTNLIINAREACGQDGTIAISTFERDHKAIISISDSGCGMSRSFIENELFRPFHSTKKKGMGIGLFQSKMIVEAHKGTLEVESEEGKGSTFRVILPITNN